MNESTAKKLPRIAASLLESLRNESEHWEAVRHALIAVRAEFGLHGYPKGIPPFNPVEPFTGPTGKFDEVLSRVAARSALCQLACERFASDLGIEPPARASGEEPQFH